MRLHDLQLRNLSWVSLMTIPRFAQDDCNNNKYTKDWEAAKQKSVSTPGQEKGDTSAQSWIEPQHFFTAQCVS